MGGREKPASIQATSAEKSLFPFEAIHEVNERCLEVLAQVARSDVHSVMLRPTLRELLRESSPEDRMRAAARAYLLVDFEFRNLPWWEAVRRSPEKPFPGSAGRPCFPKRSAVALAHMLLIAAREAIRVDVDIANLTLGVDPRVAGLLSGLPITAIDRIPGAHFRHIEVRWLDRLALWRSLLRSGANPTSSKARQFEAHCLQLLAGDLLPNMELGHDKDQQPPRSTQRR
ncbi:MAG TPA: hypothetical protein VJ738_19570 [Steroidobacteraceae bacterium]|nr:hypothetical protein [Steroidobacteraceae bacterium]